MEADVGPPLGPFARDLRTGTGAGTTFLPPMPQDDDAWGEALRTAAAATSPVPVDLAEALARRQADLGAGPRAVANARLLASTNPRAVAVVTGQQPGLLGGPLLTFHKAAGAIALARRLDALSDVRVVPVFWLASEDHDFDEANRAGVLARDGRLQALKLAVQGDGRSIADLDVPMEARVALMEQLTAALPDTDRARAAADLARVRTGEGFATWAARTLLSIFGDTGLVLVEPEVLDPWVAPSYAWLLDHREAINEAVNATGRRLADAGLPAPLAPKPDATPLFYRSEIGGPRLRVGVDGEGRVALRSEPAGFDLPALKQRLTDEPRRGAGNVIGRVFIQNRHLPVFAYIAGPTEIAYQAQLAAAAAALGLPFPLALPRPEATWVQPRDLEAAEAFGLGIGEVLRGAEASTPRIESELAATEAGVRSALGTAVEAEAGLVQLGPRTAEALRRMRERLLSTFEKSYAGVRRAAAADLGVGAARFERLLAAVRPGGKPQERVLSPLSLIARFGIDSVRTGLLSLDPLAPAHHLVRLGEENAPA